VKLIAARTLCAVVTQKSIIVSQDRMNGASLLGRGSRPNRPPLCTNIEALLGIDFLQTTVGAVRSILQNPQLFPQVAGKGGAAVENG
jgi:hypothetical protein